MEMIRRGSVARHRRVAALALVAAVALLASACGSRLTGSQALAARGASSNGAASNAGSGTGTGTGTASATGSGTSTTIASATGTGTGSTATGTGTGTGATATTAPGAGTGGASTGASAPCGANGNETPSGGNGGATATGVTATTIKLGNIASISGVAPGLTQSAQQAMEAWAAYVNSTGGICGRQVKIDPYDDGNSSTTDYADATQACSADFAMVGNASGFDDGGATAVNACGIPDMAAEVSTAAAGAAADIFGASPGNAHYWALGPANYLKSTYPTAIQHAAMIYLNVSATQTQAEHEVAAYTSDGFKYVYDTSTTPTNANYAANVQAMQSAGAQYVTEYSDDDSAERLLEAMQQANYTPQVVDWFSEEYSSQFAQQTSPESNGDLVLLSATAAYNEVNVNPGLQLMEKWLNQVAPGYTQNIFAILAWSAGLAFEQALKTVGPDLTRPAIIKALQGITTWTGDGTTPPVNIGQKIPSKCFAYFKIENGAFQRVYPTAANTYDCASGYFTY
jgi:ABC-type branched-subunit amino acid transport system substrate-binding protein